MADDKKVVAASDFRLVLHWSSQAITETISISLSAKWRRQRCRRILVLFVDKFNDKLHERPQLRLSVATTELLILGYEGGATTENENAADSESESVVVDGACTIGALVHAYACGDRGTGPRVVRLSVRTRRAATRRLVVAGCDAIAPAEALPDEVDHMLRALMRLSPHRSLALPSRFVSPSSKHRESFNKISHSTPSPPPRSSSASIDNRHAISHRQGRAHGPRCLQEVAQRRADENAVAARVQRR